MSKFSKVLTTAFIGAAALLTGCTNHRKTESALKKMNYTIVEYKGHAWYGADKNDSYADLYRVVPPAGKDTITVVVSGGYGFGKSPTIRVR